MVSDLMPHAPGSIFYAALDLDKPNCIFEKTCLGCGRGVIYYLRSMDEPMKAICPRCGAEVDLRHPEIIHPRLEDWERELGQTARSQRAQAVPA